MDERPVHSAGRGWRGVAWTAVILAALIAAQVLSCRARRAAFDPLKDAAGVAGIFLVPLVSGIGAMCGMAGATAASKAGDRRFLVILPCLANLELLLSFVATMLAGLPT